MLSPDSRVDPQDAVAMMHIVKEACDQHRTHKWTHVQPIWFKNPTDEFPELIEFVQQQSKEYFMHQVMHRQPELHV